MPKQQRPLGNLLPEPWCAAAIWRSTQSAPDLTGERAWSQSQLSAEQMQSEEREKAYEAILSQHYSEHPPVERTAAPPNSAALLLTQQAAKYSAQSAALEARAGWLPQRNYHARLERLAQRSRLSIRNVILLISVPLGLYYALAIWQLFHFFMLGPSFSFGPAGVLEALLQLILIAGVGIAPYLIVRGVIQGAFNTNYQQTYIQLQNTGLPALIADMHLYITSIEETSNFPRWGKTEAGPGAAFETHLHLAVKFRDVLLSFIPGQTVVRERAMRHAFSGRYQLDLSTSWLVLLALGCTFGCGPLGCVLAPFLAGSAGQISIKHQGILAAICDFFRGEPDLVILGLKLRGQYPVPAFTRPGVSHPPARASERTKPSQDSTEGQQP